MPGRTSLRGLATGAAVLFLSALAACASSGQGEQTDAFAAASGQARTVRIIVQNMNFSDARLYTHTRGGRKQLGIVGGKQDAEFELDWPLPEPLQIEINLLAGPQCFTQSVPVDPGDVLELQISSVFSQSAACRV